MTMDMNAYSSFTYNFQKLEATRCPSKGKWINKEVYPWNNGLLFNDKKK